jgi:probable phosphoglycerate mutase
MEAFFAILPYMDLFLIRHGQTDANANGIVQGWLDTDLNEYGRSQACDAAREFNENLDAIYTSDLKRATQTANEFCKKYLDIPYFQDSRLRERNFGDATGSHRDDHDWEAFWASMDPISIPNAETLEEYNARVESFINSLKKTGFLKILIVTHSGTINRILDLTSDSYQHTTHDNASITRITI